MIFGFFLFHEKTDFYHIFGMIWLIISIIIIGFSQYKNNDNYVLVEGENFELVSKFVPIGLAILATIYYCARTLSIKIYRIKFNFTVLEFISFNMLIYGFVFLIIWIFIINKEGVDPILLRNGLLGGITQGLGSAWAYYATSHGYTGPAAALVNIQSIIQIIIIWIFMNQLPTLTEFGGFTLGIIGSFIMIIGKDLVNLLCRILASNGNK